MGKMDPRDPRISPAFADTSNYPANMLVVTGELDSSALESEELAEKAKTEGAVSGRNVIIRRMKGCGHGFDKKNTDEACVSAKDETYGLAVDILKKIVAESS
jgi:acetyl esterase/lipase